MTCKDVEEDYLCTLLNGYALCFKHLYGEEYFDNVGYFGFTKEKHNNELNIIEYGGIDITFNIDTESIFTNCENMDPGVLSEKLEYLATSNKNQKFIDMWMNVTKL